MSTAANRYAKALFDHSREADRLDVVRSDLADLKKLYRASEDFRDFIDDPLVPLEDRKVALEALLGGKADPATIEFLLFLASKKRLGLLRDIGTQFARQYNEAKGILVARITSAAPLSAEQLDQIKTRLQAKFGKTIEAEVKIDPAMIGGFKVRMGDTIHDYSIATQLEELKKKLINA